MKKISLWALLVTIAGVFVSCEVDFDPNDSWKEQMIVYSILDQDKDTTFVRVEKCFLGEGNAMMFAKEKDSIYYRPDEISVKMYACDGWDTNHVTDTFEFAYTTRAKDEGEFYSSDGDCPIYYCVTKGRLSIWKYYKLVVTNLRTGNTARSGTYLIADYSINTPNLTFYEANDRQKVEWTNVTSPSTYGNMISNVVAKQFQVNIRFQYLQNSQIKYIDIPISKKLNDWTNSTNLNTYVSVNDVVQGIYGRLKGQSGLAWYAYQPFQVRVLACDLAMFDYISINSTSTSSLNYKPTYTNIENGIGLFASRRTEIYTSYTDSQVSATLKTKIAELGLGF